MRLTSEGKVIDDLRVVLPIPQYPTIFYESSPDGTHRARRRVKLRDKHDLTIRVRPLKREAAIVVEGSFAGFLQGHAIVGSTNLVALVEETLLRILQQLEVRTSRRLRRQISRGDLKLERVDIVGFMNCSQFGGPATVIDCLDAAFAGGGIPRLIYPRETLLLDVASTVGSESLYNKGAQMQAVHPGIWESLDPALQRVATEMLRLEMRWLRPMLMAHGFRRVCEFDWATAKSTFELEMQELFGAAKLPIWSVPTKRMDKTDMVIALDSVGIDAMHGANDSTRRRVQAEAERRRRTTRKLGRPPPALQAAVRSVKEFTNEKIRFGAPRELIERRLVWTAAED